MKKVIPLGIAAAALLICGPVSAQSYQDSKDNDNLMNETQRISPNKYGKAKKESSPVDDTDGYGSKDYSDDMLVGTYDDFTGLYGGIDGGYDVGGDLDGWNAGLFAGYGHEFDLYNTAIYTAIELGYEWSDGDDDSGGVGYEKNHAWLATIKPGMKVSEDILGYGILGYSRAEYESSGDDEDLDGLVLGLGGEFDTNTVFKPRLEYTYTQYEEQDVGGLSLDPEEHDVKIGAVFQF